MAGDLAEAPGSSKLSAGHGWKLYIRRRRGRNAQSATKNQNDLVEEEKIENAILE